jgi:hypothetical protein
MNKEIVPIERIAGSIYLLRGQRVMLDFDRAGLYGVATKVLNQALKCDTIRFLDDFMFQLSRNEVERISQIVTASSGAQRSRSQFAELEKRVGKHDERIDAILEAIRQLMAPPEKPPSRNWISCARDGSAISDAEILMIAWTIYITFAGAIAALVLPRTFSRWIALLTTGAGFAISLSALFCRDLDLAHFTTIVQVPWVPALGMNYHLAVDGISLTLVLGHINNGSQLSALFLGRHRTAE